MSHTSYRLLDALLFAHFEADKHLFGGSLEKFSEHLLDLNETLPLPARTHVLSTQTNVVKRMEVNGKTLRRYQDERSANRMPAELVGVFIATVTHLDACSGQRLKTAVARELLGSLYVPVPQGCASQDLMALGKLSREFGDVCLALAPILADGVIDARDTPKQVQEALQQLDELTAAAFAIKARLMQVCPDVPPGNDLLAQVSTVVQLNAPGGVQ